MHQIIEVCILKVSQFIIFNEINDVHVQVWKMVLASGAKIDKVAENKIAH